MEILIQQAYRLGASDLHLTAGRPPYIRIDGQLMPLAQQVFSVEQIEALARDLLTGAAWEQFVKQGEVDAAGAWDGGYRCRIHAYRRQGGSSLAIRLFPMQIPTPAELGLPRSVLEMVQQRQGLILISGPTGSGKTTTAASLLDYVSQLRCLRILTLEDPIEYVYSSGQSLIEQREIGRDTFDFASGLRSAFRQDPDLILVGELRDPETVQTAIRAAEAGRLVLGTLHTGNSVQTVSRVIDAFSPEVQSTVRSQLASLLIGIISQRLFPVAEGKGRVAAFEVLRNTPAVAHLIRTEQLHQIQSLLQTGSKYGMTTLKGEVERLKREGRIRSCEWTSPSD